MNQGSHRPRRRMGQNFLRDKTVIHHIINAIAPAEDEHLVEIGPGLGALTESLLNRSGQLDVVELDRDLAHRLEQQWGEHTHFHLHSADALRFDFSALASVPGELRVVGNLPYNISTPLLFHLLAHKAAIHDMHFMLQQEVVTRMAAVPGSRDWGRLSVMLQSECQVQPLFSVPPEAFHPVPKVTSAIVRIAPHRQAPVKIVDREAFALVVNTAFSKRRKTLRNSLRGLVDEAQIRTAGIDPIIRAEQLGVAEFAALSTFASRSIMDKKVTHKDCG